MSDEAKVVSLFRSAPMTTTGETQAESIPSELEAAFATMQRSLFDALEREKALVAALEWCSGSADFGQSGQAQLGWARVVAPALKASHEAAKTVAFGRGEGP